MSARAAEIANDLYALAPDAFTAARDKAAKAARDDGDRELADAVKQFRRPSIGAWLVNSVARTDQLDDLLDLGTALREAQRTLAGNELRAMSRQRHQVVRSLSELAREVTGKTVSDAAQREFEATLEAALADDAAADAVRTGRLMRPLSSTGLEPVDLTDAVAAPDQAPPARRPANKPAPKQTDDKAAREKRAAELAAAISEAEGKLAGAGAELERREQELRDAAGEVDAARTRVKELEAELDAARERQTSAEQARRTAEVVRKSAARARDAAQRALDTARKRV